MILTKNIKIKITPRNLKFYNKKGMDCKIDDIIDYPVSKLSLGSHSILDVECDYCGSVYNINYNNYNMKTKNGFLPACCNDVNCIKQKRLLSTQDKYGVDNVFQLNEIKDKIKETNLELYGVENPQQNLDIKIKSGNTNLKKYGVINVFQSELIKEKMKNTNFKNYGFDYPSQNESFYQKKLKDGVKIRYIDDLYYQSSYEKEFIIKYKDILKMKNGLSIEYYYLNERKIYHSDFYLPEYNLIVEIKSTYWYNKKIEICKAKEEYTKKSYNYIMILDKNYNEFDKIINK
jgi:hypothetical protein